MRKLVPVLLATRTRESTRALGKILCAGPRSEKDVPLLREVESLDSEHPASHSARAQIYNLLSMELEQTRPIEALKWKRLALVELERPQVKHEFYYDMLLQLARAERRSNPAQARQHLRQVLSSPPNGESIFSLSRSHINFTAILGLLDLGDVSEGKAQLADLTPRLSRQIQMYRVSLLDKFDLGRLEHYLDGCHDLMCCYAWLSDKKAAEEVLHDELQTLHAVCPDDSARMKRVQQDYEQAMKTQPLH